MTSLSAWPTPARPRAVVLAVGGTISRRDVATWCDRVRLLLDRSDVDALICDVSGLIEPDAVAVDALARMQLTARRLGRPMGLRNAAVELRDLLAFFGLEDVFPPCTALLVGDGWQAEEREQARRLEEVVEPDDPTV
jgi:ABC-type transporter Mla MlaB component